MTKRISRLAPSPTGALHLGNARTFLVNWALARQRDWRLLMRIEDLDTPRVKAGAAAQTLDILCWLGLDYDGAPLYQSRDLAPYRAALNHLVQRKMSYACRRSRRDVERAASAPHADEHELRCPPELRPTDPGAFRTGHADANYRFTTPDETVEIADALAGTRRFRPFDEVGDFVIWTRRDEPAYQLAVVVDDARQGVTDVVRGDDLLPSAARQALLCHALDLATPRWWHLPLVLGPDGRRLAKRHGDTRIDHYREAGVGPERIVGLLAHWSGASSVRDEMSAADFLSAFEVDRLGREAVVFTTEDDRWLRLGQRC